MLGLAAWTLLACGGAPASEEGPSTYVFEGSTMGTYYVVKVVAGALTEAEQGSLAAAVAEELDDVNAKMSTYLPDSEVSRLNRHDTTPFPVSPATFEVLQEALAVSRDTGGAFDVTVAPLVRAWGFGPQTEVPPPRLEPAAIRELLERIGYARLTLDGASQTVVKERADLTLDLSGIAKGYAVDRVAERLLALGRRDVWVEVGGEVRAAGVNAGGKPWRLGIEKPLETLGEVQRIVPLSNLAVATSGDYRNYREVDGARFSHIIDPRTGWPIDHRVASVSVIHPRCTVADALATALLVMGSAEGYEFALGRSLPVLFLVREGDKFVEHGTPAFWDLTPTPGAPPG